ncbi:MAG: hypothetical protein J6K92_12605, partial [Oscillospiraceae bacterium]|nr:hypothetical protein [Oscillospiraceae bacterium]
VRRRRNHLYGGAPQRGELKIVLWTIFKRGTPCDRGRSPSMGLLRVATLNTMRPWRIAKV